MAGLDPESMLFRMSVQGFYPQHNFSCSVNGKHSVLKANVTCSADEKKSVGLAPEKTSICEVF